MIILDGNLSESSSKSWTSVDNHNHYSMILPPLYLNLSRFMTDGPAI